jgi:hypothetical protein
MYNVVVEGLASQGADQNFNKDLEKMLGNRRIVPTYLQTNEDIMLKHMIDFTTCENENCENDGILKCPVCQCRYCSKECQKSDWKFHKEYCVCNILIIFLLFLEKHI